MLAEDAPAPPDWGNPPAVRVAVVATGTIGRSWIVAFARAGCRVAAWDPNGNCLADAVAWARAQLPRAAADRVIPCERLAACAAGADYLQENGPERLDAKQAIYRALTEVAAPRALLASSTSTLDITDISALVSTEDQARCVVAHPVNPPHVVPVVELLGGRGTSAATVEAAARFLTAVGQRPVRLTRYVPGFLLNRLQAALVREAVHLVATGVARVDDVDAVISDGLGLRWALMGPFGVANTNADGGAREYFTRYGSSFQRLWSDLANDVRLTPDLIERIGREVDAMYPAVSRERLRAWRDEMVTALRQTRTPADP
jgi:3-hydroxyacyl-CoA dehydrogenase